MVEEFQAASSSKSGNYKRVYIGNLPNSFSSQEALHEALDRWMCEQIPDLSINSIQVSSSGKSLHALVDCGAQANHVIRSLHQKSWAGKTLNVQREKRTNNKVNSISNKTNFTKKPAFGGKGWSAPNTPLPVESGVISSTFSKIPIDQATQDIKSVVEEEFKHAEAMGEDAVNVAIAATAAASFLAAMGAFGDEDQPFSGDDGALPTTVIEDEYCDDGPIHDETPFRIKPMAELMADFGEQDPNWQKLQPTEDAQVGSSVDKDVSTNTNSQLAPKGKAPIHISLTSFGFSKGAPKRMDGWSHRQPLLPLDCRDFPTVPNYLAWQDGLSGAVKRALQYPQHASHRAKEKEGPSKQSLHDFARKTVAPQVFQALLDAQNQGGHGYISPLEMTIYVGSDLGRHRSVVVCEWAAIQLRKMLRQNSDNVVHQPVSVGTVHRDVEPRRQHHYNLKSDNTNANELQGKTLKKKQMDLAGDW
jgi:hypothetical protein